MPQVCPLFQTRGAREFTALFQSFAYTQIIICLYSNTLLPILKSQGFIFLGASKGRTWGVLFEKYAPYYMTDIQMINSQRGTRGVLFSIISFRSA